MLFVIRAIELEMLATGAKVIVSEMGLFDDIYHWEIEVVEPSCFLSRRRAGRSLAQTPFERRVALRAPRSRIRRLPSLQMGETASFANAISPKATRHRSRFLKSCPTRGLLRFAINLRKKKVARELLRLFRTTTMAFLEKRRHGRDE